MKFCSCLNFGSDKNDLPKKRSPVQSEDHRDAMRTNHVRRRWRGCGLIGGRLRRLWLRRLIGRGLSRGWDGLLRIGRNRLLHHWRLCCRGDRWYAGLRGLHLDRRDAWLRGERLAWSDHSWDWEQKKAKRTINTKKGSVWSIQKSRNVNFAKTKTTDTRSNKLSENKFFKNSPLLTYSDSSGCWLPPRPSAQPQKQRSWAACSARRQRRRRQSGGKHKGDALSPSQKQTAGVSLQGAERRWLLAHYLIRVGGVNGWGDLRGSDHRLVSRQREDRFERSGSSTCGN